MNEEQNASALICIVHCMHTYVEQVKLAISTAHTMYFFVFIHTSYVNLILHRYLSDINTAHKNERVQYLISCSFSSFTCQVEIFCAEFLRALFHSNYDEILFYHRHEILKTEKVFIIKSLSCISAR